MNWQRLLCFFGWHKATHWEHVDKSEYFPVQDILVCNYCDGVLEIYWNGQPRWRR